MSRASEYVVEVRDLGLNRLASIPTELLDLNVTLRLNDVSEFTLRLPRGADVARLLMQKGAGVIVSRDELPLFSGVVTGYKMVSDVSFPAGVFEFTGISDEFVIRDKCAWADPANELSDDKGESLQTADHDKFPPPPPAVLLNTGAVGCIWYYVMRNAGNGIDYQALPSRQDAYTIMLTELDAVGTGQDVVREERYTPLLEVCQGVADVGGVSFRVVQKGGHLALVLRENRDISDFVRLDVMNSQLEKIEVENKTPTLTRVAVMGQGEGVDRIIRLIQTPEAEASEIEYGRKIESFKDRRDVSDDDPDDPEKQKQMEETLKNAGLEELQDKDTDALLAVAVPNGVSGLKLFVDYNLGDIVAVVLGDVEMKAKVTGVAIKVAADGVYEVFSVGDVSNFSDAGLVGRLQSKANARIGNLERAL